MPIFGHRYHPVGFYMASFISIRTSRIALFLLSVLLILWVETFVLHHPAFQKYPTELATGVLFDLVAVVTALFYWLVARPLQLAPSRLVLVGLLMFRVALFILPASAFPLPHSWPTLIALGEGALVLVAIFRIRTIRQVYQRLRLETDSQAAWRGALASVFGEKIADVVISEGTMIYFAFWGWRLPSDLAVTALPLTTHRQSGQVAMTIGLIMVMLIEGLGVHLLLARWNPTVAYWVTGLSLYSLLFFIADLWATLKRPSYLSHHTLHLRLGIRWQATIPVSAIAQAVSIQDKPSRQAGHLNGAFLTTPNLLLTFHQPIRIRGPYGIQKEVHSLALFLDNRTAFVQKIPL